MDLRNFPLLVQFYETARECDLEEYEARLDQDDVDGARKVLSQVLHSETQVTAGRDYLEEPPQRGDMVFVQTTGRYSRLLAISDDRKKAIVKDWLGAYVVNYQDLRRVQ